ncbi:hypothetical protein [Amycolatopsis sp. NBRC 101858]|uniref:hypothetical protein n=1 Tax=Amycolatopsis sp. NBRC 101858 TaxID=3032200 RepID=UPI00333CB949
MVHAVAEGEVRCGRAGDVELVGGVAVLGGVAPGGAEADQDRVAGRITMPSTSMSSTAYRSGVYGIGASSARWTTACPLSCWSAS